MNKFDLTEVIEKGLVKRDPYKGQGRYSGVWRKGFSDGAIWAVVTNIPTIEVALKILWRAVKYEYGLIKEDIKRRWQK